MHGSPASGSTVATRRAFAPVVWRMVLALLLAAAVAAPVVTPAWASDHEGGQPGDGASAVDAPAGGPGPAAVRIERADGHTGAVVGGQPVAYAIGLENTGAADLTEPSLRYEVPVGVSVSGVDAPAPWTCVLPSDGDVGNGSLYCTLEVLAPGQQAPQIVLTLVVGDDAEDQVPNVVVAQSQDTEPVEASETTQVHREAQLSVTKADDVEATVPFGGESFSYTMTVSNAGPSAARTVTLLDELPPGVTVTGVSVPQPWTCVLPSASNGSLFCTLQALGAGSTAPAIVMDVAVDEDFSGEIRNLVVVDSDDTGPVEAAETTTVDVETEVRGVVLEKPSASAPGKAPSTDVQTAQVLSEQLARTGVEVEQLVPWVVLLLGLGASLVLAARRLNDER